MSGDQQSLTVYHFSAEQDVGPWVLITKMKPLTVQVLGVRGTH